MNCNKRIDFHNPRFLCFEDLQAIIPNTISTSLSYYEEVKHLIKVVNKIIACQMITAAEINEINKDLAKINEWIENFDYHFLNEILSKYFSFAIFVEITDSGYIVYNIPESWKDINFNTSGLDIEEPGLDYGHLILSY